MMIWFERTRDLEAVRVLMSQAVLYRRWADDFAGPAAEFKPNSQEAIWYVLARDGEELLGVWITHPINPVLWEVHHALLPTCWGARAHQVAQAFEEWLWRHTSAQTVVGFTPASNLLALRFARRHGMTDCGRVPRAFLKGGRLVDLVIFAKGRPCD